MCATDTPAAVVCSFTSLEALNFCGVADLGLHLLILKAHEFTTPRRHAATTSNTDTAYINLFSEQKQYFLT